MPLEPLEQVVVERDVGAAEAVDALLGIANQEQLARCEADVTPVGRKRQSVALVGAEIEGDFGLQRIGVLKLVHEDAPVAPLSRMSDRWLVAQQVARPRQQVLKRSYAVRLALAHAIQHELAQKHEYAGERCRAVGREDSADFVVRVLQDLPGHPTRQAAVGQLAPAPWIAASGIQPAERNERGQRFVFRLGGHETSCGQLGGVDDLQQRVSRSVQRILRPGRKLQQPGTHCMGDGQRRRRLGRTPGRLCVQQIVLAFERRR